MKKLAWILALVVGLGTLSAGIAIAAGRGSVAQVTGDENEAADTEESLTGSNADRAAGAALAAAGGGEVLEVEAADGGDADAAYEVEVRRADGSVAEVLLDARFKVLGVSEDD